VPPANAKHHHKHKLHRTRKEKLKTGASSKRE